MLPQTRLAKMMTLSCLSAPLIAKLLSFEFSPRPNKQTIVCGFWFLLLALSAGAQNHSAASAGCRIRGTVVDRNSVELVLAEETQDERFSGISIPIKNKRFDYVIQSPKMVMYRLFFRDEMNQGVMRPLDFFPDSSELVFTLYPMELADRNIILGGAANREYKSFKAARDSTFFPVYRPFWKRMDELYKAGTFFSSEYTELQKKLSSADTKEKETDANLKIEKLKAGGLQYSAEGAAVMHDLDSISKLKMYWLDDYFAAHTGIVSLSVIYQMLKDQQYYGSFTDIAWINDNLPRFEKTLPDSPYIKEISGMLQAINRIRIGNMFPDFEAPTLEGKMVKLSDSIRGKYALIDLWASWCGSCRALNRMMIPVYEKYRNSGFTIMGVAREFRNDAALRTALKNDKLPWLTLLELENAGGIWNKYGLGGAGGCTYLVDPDGHIIAIHPDADELSRILEEKLKR